MSTLKETIRAFIAVVFALAGLGVRPAMATVYPIDWLQMVPTPYNSTVPNNSVFNLPGVGNVTVTYSYPAYFTQARGQSPLLTAGSIVSGLDTYAWTNYELFSTVFSVGPDPLVPIPWTITYTFPGTIPAGSLYLGVAGLGQTTSFGGGASTAQVSQNGTFLGDWTGGGNYGATQYSGGAGTFSMQNSQTGAGGADPWWNSALGVVRIDDAVSSLTVNLSQIRGDGIGLDIGFVPEPSTAALLGIGALLAMRRQRR